MYRRRKNDRNIKDEKIDFNIDILKKLLDNFKKKFREEFEKYEEKSISLFDVYLNVANKEFRNILHESNF